MKLDWDMETKMLTDKKMVLDLSHHGMDPYSLRFVTKTKNHTLRIWPMHLRGYWKWTLHNKDDDVLIGQSVEAFTELEYAEEDILHYVSNQT